MERVRVECYAGYQADQEPVAVHGDGGRRRVVGIERRWVEPGAAFFRVRLEDGGVWLLRHDRRADCWDIVAVTP